MIDGIQGGQGRRPDDLARDGWNLAVLLALFVGTLFVCLLVHGVIVVCSWLLAWVAS